MLKRTAMIINGKALVRTIAVLMLLDVGSVSGATWYVATNGNNSADGSLATPWATIRYGVIKMAGGDTLNIRGGTYGDDGFTIEEFKSGPATNPPTIIQSYPGEWAVYYPGTNIRNGNFHAMLISTKSNIVLNGFEIDAHNCFSSGIKLTTGSLNVTITNVTVRGCPIGMGILTSGADEGDVMNSLITHCRFITNGWGGPLDTPASHPDLHQLYIQTSGMTVENCHFEGATNTHGWTKGIHYFGTGCANGVFRNNFFTNCDNGIIAASSYGSNCWIYNNVICGSPSYGIDVYQMSFVYVANNTCYSNGANIRVRSSTNVWVENNITIGGKANPGGIFADQGANGVVVQNNLAYNNCYSDFRSVGAFNVTTSSNLFNVTDIEGTKTTNAVAYDARFVNPATNNFRVLTGSDAIGRGKPQSLFTTDAGGVPRASSNWTIGAWQYRLPAPSNLKPQ